MNTKSIYKIFLESNSVCTDTRNLQENDLFFALKGDNFNGNKFAKQAIQSGAKFAIIDEKEFEGENTILVKDVLETLQELSTHHRKQLDIPIIAITGSNGKTTTKELINTVLSQKYNTTATEGNLNNHIGVPLTLLTLTNKTEIGIVEMGANHPKEIEFLCNIALPDYGYITNFGKAHLEGFGSIEGVIKAKSELYDFLKERDKTIFINEDDSIQVEKTKNFNTFSYSEDKKSSDININLIEANPFIKLRFNETEIQSNLIGLYNLKNISAAISIGNYFKVSDKDIAKAIENYSPTNNRSQIINKNSNKIILDAYNANPTSMQAAIESFNKLKDKHKIAFLGDMFELGKESSIEHQNIVDLLENTNLSKAYVVGSNFGETKTNSSDIVILNSYEELNRILLNKSFENCTILIKGSRGMAMERIIDLL